MSGNHIVLGLVGSPNKTGRTNELVSAALEGARSEGAAIELIQMSDCVVGACKDCMPWVCNTNQKCAYNDKNFRVIEQEGSGLRSTGYRNSGVLGRYDRDGKIFLSQNVSCIRRIWPIERFAGVRNRHRRWQWQWSDNGLEAALSFLQDNADAGN